MSSGGIYFTCWKNKKKFYEEENKVVEVDVNWKHAIPIVKSYLFS